MACASAPSVAKSSVTLSLPSEISGDYAKPDGPRPHILITSYATLAMKLTLTFTQGSENEY